MARKPVNWSERWRKVFGDTVKHDPEGEFTYTAESIGALIKAVQRLDQRITLTDPCPFCHRVGYHHDCALEEVTQLADLVALGEGDYKGEDQLCIHHLHNGVRALVDGGDTSGAIQLIANVEEEIQSLSQQYGLSPSLDPVRCAHCGEENDIEHRYGDVHAHTVEALGQDEVDWTGAEPESRR